jgi:hypothetical protein
MPRRKVTTVSLKQALQLGTLGMLEPGLPLHTVAELLGPPHWWITDTQDGPVPTYWFYPNGLEMSFEQESPYRLRYYKLSNVNRREAKVTATSPFLRIRNDVPIFQMRVSDFLRSALWDPANVRVGICRHPLFLGADICIGRMRLAFSMSADNEERLSALLTDPNRRRDDQIWVLDAHCELLGVYFLSQEPTTDRFAGQEWETFSAEHYLHLLDSVAATDH